MTFLDSNFPIFEYENFDTHVQQASCLYKFQGLLELLENLERGNSRIVGNWISHNNKSHHITT